MELIEAKNHAERGDDNTENIDEDKAVESKEGIALIAPGMKDEEEEEEGTPTFNKLSEKLNITIPISQERSASRLDRLASYISSEEDRPPLAFTPVHKAATIVKNIIQRRKHPILDAQIRVPADLLTRRAKIYAEQRRHDSKSCKEHGTCVFILFIGSLIWVYSFCYLVLPYNTEERVWPMNQDDYDPEDSSEVHIFWSITVYAALFTCMMYNLMRKRNGERFVVSALLFIVSLILGLIFPWTLGTEEWAFYFSALAGAVNCGILAAVLYRWFSTLFHGNMPFYTLPMMYRKPIKLSDAKSALKTGDLVFCSEARKCTSQVIRFFTYSPYSHVGMIVRDPTPAVRRAYGLRPVIGGDDKWDGTADDVYVFEATPPGVQLLELDEWMIIEDIEYPHSMTGIRQLDLGYSKELRCTCGRPRSGKTHEELTAIIAPYMVECKNKLYETNVVELAKSAFELNFDHGPEEVFCSELVAYCYDKMGLLATNRLPNNYSPITFSGSNRYVDPLILSAGVRLAPHEWRIIIQKLNRKTCCQMVHSVMCFPCEIRDRRKVKKFHNQTGHMPDFIGPVVKWPCKLPFPKSNSGNGATKEHGHRLESDIELLEHGDDDEGL